MKKILNILLVFMLLGFVQAQYTPTNIAVAYELDYTGSGLQPGDSGVLTLTVSNSGGLNAEDVIVKIGDTGSLHISKQWEIGDLVPLDSRTVSAKFTVRDDAQIGLNTLTVDVFYDGYDSSGDLQNYLKKSWEIPVEVTASPSFIIENVRSDRALEPGGTVELEVQVKNNGAGAAYDVDGELSLSSIAGINAIGAAKQYIGGVERGSSATFAFSLYLDDSLATGAYSLPLTLTYEDKGHNPASTTLYAGVQVAGDIRLSLSVYESDPEEIHAGEDDVKLTVKLENLGTKDVRNLKVTFEAQEPFENSKSYTQTKDIGTVSSGSSQTADFYANVLEDADSGLSAQSFLVEYRVDNVEYKERMNLTLEVKDYPDFEVYAEETTGRAGGSATLRVEVRNTGEDCESVTLWALKKSEQPFDFKDKSEFIGDLKKGESGQAVFEFTLDPDAKAKEYILPLEVRCTKDDDVLTFSRSARIQVFDGPGSNLLLYAAALLVIGLIAGLAYRYKRR